jgi:hypothetical protein
MAGLYIDGFEIKALPAIKEVELPNVNYMPP